MKKNMEKSGTKEQTTPGAAQENVWNAAAPSPQQTNKHPNIPVPIAVFPRLRACAHAGQSLGSCGNVGCLSEIFSSRAGGW
jgi:hypothetical protein